MQLFLYSYLFLGLIYGIYVTGWGEGKWYFLPINIIGGPIVACIIIFKALTGKKFYY